ADIRRPRAAGRRRALAARRRERGVGAAPAAADRAIPRVPAARVEDEQRAELERHLLALACATRERGVAEEVAERRAPPALGRGGSRGAGAEALDARPAQEAEHHLGPGGDAPAEAFRGTRVRVERLGAAVRARRGDLEAARAAVYRGDRAGEDREPGRDRERAEGARGPVAGGVEEGGAQLRRHRGEDEQPEVDEDPGAQRGAARPARRAATARATRRPEARAPLQEGSTR